MLLRVPQVVSADEAARMRARLESAPWADGRATAGYQSAQEKRNEQLPEDCAAAKELGAAVLAALQKNALFFAAALPRRVYPPLFNRYAGGMDFGSHVDNAIRFHPPSGERFRTDVSATLFLTPPEAYDGGELVVEDTYGVHQVKLPAGDMVLYPATSRHRVMPVTRGARIASFFWIESMVRDDAQRALLFDLDVSIQQLTREASGSSTLVPLTACYHNLLRMWADA